MQIQKIFSDIEGDERLYSVLMNEEELSFFSEVQKEFGVISDFAKNQWNKLSIEDRADARHMVRDTKNALFGGRLLERAEKYGANGISSKDKNNVKKFVRFANVYKKSPITGEHMSKGTVDSLNKKAEEKGF